MYSSQEWARGQKEGTEFSSLRLWNPSESLSQRRLTKHRTRQPRPSNSYNYYCRALAQCPNDSQPCSHTPEKISFTFVDKSWSSRVEGGYFKVGMSLSGFEV